MERWIIVAIFGVLLAAYIFVPLPYSYSWTSEPYGEQNVREAYGETGKCLGVHYPKLGMGMSGFDCLGMKLDAMVWMT